jgi:alkylation response protein AidB-like acyl-CoA dehydrogenase
MADQLDIDQFRAEARAWLTTHAKARPSSDAQRSGAPASEDDEHDITWGVGSDSVAVFHNVTPEQEAATLEEVKAWQRAKFDAGLAMIDWPVELGGRGLPRSFLRAYNQEEAKFETPDGGEIAPTSMGLIAPTIAAYGNDDQKKMIVPFMRMDEVGCQLFSEPSAGSDLASVSTKAVRDGDEWILNGQKVWTSSARCSEWGLAITRHDPTVPKHKGLTAFLVPFNAPGVEVRPIKQMSGGSNFNEVFLTDVRLSDHLHRLGAVGDGWRVALTCLGFERDHSGGGGHVGGGFQRLLAAARHFERNDDPIVRQALADSYIRAKVSQYTNRRAAAAIKAGGVPGPEGSLSKLMWTDGMRHTSDVISLILGPRLLADTGEWGTFAWGEHVLGAPGYRIAGGSDEVQRNIIGERVLGLPAEPRVDKDVPFNAIGR